MGDDEEHAILLCNYFNYIDRQLKRQIDDPVTVAKYLSDPKQQKTKHYVSYIVYGEAVPRGETWYTLRRDVFSNNVELWDPTTGICYSFNQDSNEKAE